MPSPLLSGTACLRYSNTQLPKGRVLLFDEFFSVKTDSSKLFLWAEAILSLWKHISFHHRC